MYPTNDWNFHSTPAFRNISIESKQLQYYKEHHASSNILKLVKLNNRQFGCIVEKIIRQLLKLKTISDTTCDALLEEKRIEIKASRYWVSDRPTFRWQHIEPEHNFDIIIFVAVNFSSLDIYALSKKTLLLLIQNGIVKQQGGGSGQGYWCDLKIVYPFLTKINTWNFSNQLLSL